jgi:NDP-sugar pyrophosphorylase family protein
MKFAIIAAGEGSRLRESGIQMPKPLVKIGGIPLIDRTMNIIEACKPESVACIINENAQELHAHLSGKKFMFPFKLKVKSTPSSLHSLFELYNFIERSPFCLLTVDSIFNEFEFRNFLNAAQRSGSIFGSIAVTDYIEDEAPLYVNLNLNYEILEFRDSKNGCRWVTGGIYYFNEDISSYLKESIETGKMRLRNFLRFLLKSQKTLIGFPFSKIVDVDRISDVKEAEKFLMNKK